MIYARYDYNWMSDNNILAVISYSLDFDVIRIYFFKLNGDEEIISLKRLNRIGAVYLYMEHREEIYNSLISNDPAVIQIKERKTNNSDYMSDKTSIIIEDNCMSINCLDISFKIKDFHLKNFINFLKITISDEIIRAHILKERTEF